MKNSEESTIDEQEDPPLAELPSISIVVPNYNSGSTICATLQSLIEQNYPKLEIIVIDGGSTDNSVEVIKQFEPYITWWISEKDSGQSNAINKGFAKCNGDIVNWLCSDDLLAPDALHTVGKYFAESPDIDVLVGRSQIEYRTDNLGQPLKGANFWMTLFGRVLPLGLGSRPMILDAKKQIYIKAPTLKQIDLISVASPIHQPSCFYRRKLLERPQPLDESYEYTMDIELFNYFYSRGVRWRVIEEVLSIAPVSGDNKTSIAGVKATYELEQIYKTYTKELIPLTYWHRRLRYPLERFIKHHRSRLWLYIVGPVWVALTLLLAPFYGVEKVWALRWTKWI
ncbi:glycosyltransferase family 2 protein [Moorena sp. SIO4G3]|uniref:glycosyltransferase family 2 protein n=1 Tax=Moorena sp. SIO4G3 TaxID=2607821 RepID=UPI00142C7F22|nr:glycosyltransferase family 2 protein [Moorena sp. SIO4G3]NEO80976.1 glycosyltransferase [Moorena sp. SIO4G3]